MEKVLQYDENVPSLAITTPRTYSVPTTRHNVIIYFLQTVQLSQHRSADNRVNGKKEKLTEL